MKFTRRDFLKASAAAGAAAGMLEMAGASGARAAAQPPRLETFRQWLAADRDARKRGVEQCLSRIKELEPSIHAWVEVHPEQPTGDGLLSGIPFGAKDILETKGLATEYGSPLYKGRVGTEDAALIRELRERGAVLLGKTVTTAFAYRTPGPTRNPRNLEHTPGGSSSGSAAAIAANMIPFAVGEQTRGSIIRPASYCGVTGFKPTFDLLPTAGMLPVSKSLDTLGFFTHTPADMLALWKALGHAEDQREHFVFAAPDPAPETDPEMAAQFQRSLATLRQSGVEIRSVDISEMLKKLDAANDTLMFYEGARFHEARLQEFGDRLDRELAAMVRKGLKIPDEEYGKSQQYIADSRTKLAEIFKDMPVILTPAATGPAPLGLSTTGDPRMNAPWSALGTPAICVPMPVGNNLPLGLQMTADLSQDILLLHAAVMLQERFAAGREASKL